MSITPLRIQNAQSWPTFSFTSQKIAGGLNEKLGNVIELSNSSYNGTNSVLSIIVFIIFILFTIKMHKSLYTKINPNKPYRQPDILNSVSQNTMSAIQYFLSSPVKKKIEETNDIFMDDIHKLTGELKNSANYNEKVAAVMGNLNKKIYDHFEENYLNKFSTFLNGAMNITKKIQKISDDTITKFENAYKNYRIRLQKFVNNLISMMTTISGHIEKVTAIPDLYNMLAPLQKVYNSIYDTLKNNSGFIKMINPEFNMDNIHQPESTIKSQLASNFTASSSILRNSGYK